MCSLHRRPSMKFAQPLQQLLLSASFAGLSAAAILEDSSQLKHSYDFIIVGGEYSVL